MSSFMVVRVRASLVMGMSVARANVGGVLELPSRELSGFGCLADEDMLVDGVVISVLGVVSSTFCSEFSD